MHLNPVREANNNQPGVNDLTLRNFNIQNLVESGVWPLSLFPLSQQVSAAE
jgi:hypothetical protein